MIKKIVFASTGLLLLASPLIASAQVTDAQAKIAALTAQIQQLLQTVSQVQAKINALNATTTTSATSTTTTAPATTFVPTVAGTASCPLPLVSRDLSLGSTGLDVAALQAFLGARGYLVSGKTTGYFGPLTVVAVQKYQASSGIISSGTISTTGYGAVGPRTRTAILQECSKAAPSIPAPALIFKPISTSTSTSTPTFVPTSTSPVIQTPPPTPAPVTIPAPVVQQQSVVASFYASQSPVNAGQQVTLYWNAQNVGGCVLSQQVPGQQMYILNSYAPSSGSAVTTPTQTTMYTLACTSVGPMGAGVVRTISVYVY